MVKEQFPLQVKGFRFDAYYQRGSVDLADSRWTKDSNGPHHLVVCACGKGAYANDLDDAVHQLQKSYTVQPDGTHSHEESLTFPCNIIEAVQDGSAPWIMGRLVVPELLKDLATTPERAACTPPSAPKKPSS
jgi:hypothetical protein